jgi:hypothetical protein
MEHLERASDQHRDRFESAAIYDLVARLMLERYTDLLADHWVVPDRVVPRERLDRARFVRVRPGAGTILPAPRRRRALHETPRRTAAVRGASEGARGPDRHPAVLGKQSERVTLVERLQRVMRWWQRHLLSHLGRRKS